jgi:hypothetical protein
MKTTTRTRQHLRGIRKRLGAVKELSATEANQRLVLKIARTIARIEADRRKLKAKDRDLGRELKVQRRAFAKAMQDARAATLMFETATAPTIHFEDLGNQAACGRADVTFSHFTDDETSVTCAACKTEMEQRRADKR